jgi:excisionase family DNA binding protein
MKIEIDSTVLIDTIVERVVEQLTPLLMHSSVSNENELLMIDELVSYLKGKLKKQSIYEKVHNRTIPFLKTGNGLLFRRKHIDIWLLNPYHPDLSTYNLKLNGKGVRNNERIV